MQCPCRALLEKELESVGIRLNKSKPNIYFKVRLAELLQAQLVCLCLLKAELTLCCPCLGQAEGAVGFADCSYLAFCLLQPKKGGGISFNSTVTLTQCSEKLVQLILHEYSILS